MDRIPLFQLRGGILHMVWSDTLDRDTSQLILEELEFPNISSLLKSPNKSNVDEMAGYFRSIEINTPLYWMARI